MSAVLHSTDNLSSTVGVVTGPMLAGSVQQMLLEPARRKVLELTAMALRSDACLIRVDALEPCDLDAADGLASLALFLTAALRGRMDNWSPEAIATLALSEDVATSRWVLYVSGLALDPVAHLIAGTRAALFEELSPGPVVHVTDLGSYAFVAAACARDKWWHPSQVRLARSVMALRTGDVDKHEYMVTQAVNALAPEHHYELSNDFYRDLSGSFTDSGERAKFSQILSAAAAAHR